MPIGNNVASAVVADSGQIAQCEGAQLPRIHAIAKSLGIAKA